MLCIWDMSSIVSSVYRFLLHSIHNMLPSYDMDIKLCLHNSIWYVYLDKNNIIILIYVYGWIKHACIRIPIYYYNNGKSSLIFLYSCVQLAILFFYSAFVYSDYLCCCWMVLCMYRHIREFIWMAKKLLYFPYISFSFLVEIQNYV